MTRQSVRGSHLTELSSGRLDRSPISADANDRNVPAGRQESTDWQGILVWVETVSVARAFSGIWATLVKAA
jgi:hypothetical protein